MTRSTERRVTSSYRREFSPERSAKDPSAKKSLSENWQYREQRRQIEHSHQVSPFIWDDWTYQLSDAGEETIVENDQSRRSCSERSDDETLKDHSPSISSSSKISNDSTHSAASGGSSSRRGTKKARKQPVPSREPPSQRTYIKQSRTSSSSSCDCEESPVKHRGVSKRILSDTISKSQKRSAKYPGKKIARPQTAPIDDSPFAQYGTGDDEIETGNKRTHNILCHDEVYGSANNAKLRLEETKALSKKRLVQLATEAQNRRPKSTMFDPRFDEKMNKRTRDWRSEYGAMFNKYNTSEYRHNAQHRPPY